MVKKRAFIQADIVGGNLDIASKITGSRTSADVNWCFFGKNFPENSQKTPIYFREITWTRAKFTCSTVLSGPKRQRLRYPCAIFAWARSNAYFKWNCHERFTPGIRDFFELNVFFFMRNNVDKRLNIWWFHLDTKFIWYIYKMLNLHFS